MGNRVRTSLPLRLALDAAGILALALAFVGRGDPDVLFHVAWVVLTAETFLYGLRGSLPRIAAVAAAVVIYSMVDATGPGTPPELATNLLLSEWPLMLAIILMVAVMADREMTTSRRYARLYRRAADELITAQEDERQRLARDLHDGVGQTLTAIGLTLDAVVTSLERGDDAAPTARERVEIARTLAVTALHDTRDVAGRLRPSRLNERGLAAAVEELAANAGVSVETRIMREARSPELLPASTEIEAFRIVQEAVANAARHARAGRILVAMRVEGDGLVIEIVDDGRGFDVSTSEGRSLGIAGMRERAAMIGADLSIRSRTGAGSSIVLKIPLEHSGVIATPRPTGARLLPRRSAPSVNEERTR